MAGQPLSQARSRRVGQAAGRRHPPSCEQVACGRAADAARAARPDAHHRIRRSPRVRLFVAGVQHRDLRRPAARPACLRKASTAAAAVRPAAHTQAARCEDADRESARSAPSQPDGYQCLRDGPGCAVRAMADQCNGKVVPEGAGKEMAPDPQERHAHLLMSVGATPTTRMSGGPATCRDLPGTCSAIPAITSMPIPSR